MKKKVVEALPNLPEKSNHYPHTSVPLNDYFSNKNQLLGSFIYRVQQIETWRQHLLACLPQEKDLFQHCHVVRAEKTHLMLIAENPHWLTRLRFLIPDLLAALKKNPEHQALTAIYCKVRPPLYHNQLTPKKPRRQRLTLSTQTAQNLIRAADKIQDIKIRRALKKLAARSDEIE